MNSAKYVLDEVFTNFFCQGSPFRIKHFKDFCGKEITGLMITPYSSAEIWNSKIFLV